MRKVISFLLALLPTGCAASPEQNISRSVPVEIRTELSGDSLLINYTVKSEELLCVWKQGLLPSSIDSYPDHGTAKQTSPITTSRENFLNLKFRSNQPEPSIELWRSSGTVSIDISEYRDEQNINARLPLNLEMARCHDLFSEDSSLVYFNYYEDIYLK